MHIVIFTDFHDTSVGGVQTSIRGQRKGLEDLGHTVTIVSPPPLGKKDDEDPATICVPAMPFVKPNGFPMVAASKANQRLIETELKKRPPVDLIHAQTNMGIGLLGLRIARKFGIPLVQTMHGRDDVFAQNNYPAPRLMTTVLLRLHQWYVPHKTTVHRLDDSATAHNAWRVMINHAQAADHVVVPSHHFSVKFKAHGLTKPIDVISNGIGDEIVAKIPLKTRAAQSGQLRVIWCGRLSPEKRPLDSIKAVSSIPGCQLDIYGNGPLKDELQLYVEQHRLSDRVSFKGKVSQVEILEAIQQHDVLLYPSFGFDNQPMVLLEAVAAGTPVVYCDPDLTECMPAGGGLLTRDGTTVEALTLAIKELLANPKRRMKMHKTMLEHRDEVVQSYHSKKMAALYKQLVKNH